MQSYTLHFYYFYLYLLFLYIRSTDYNHIHYASLLIFFFFFFIVLFGLLLYTCLYKIYQTNLYHTSNISFLSMHCTLQFALIAFISCAD